MVCFEWKKAGSQKIVWSADLKTPCSLILNAVYLYLVLLCRHVTTCNFLKLNYTGFGQV
jgi:hypothetical protein